MLAMADRALRKEADAMAFVGCDLHTRTRQVAALDTDTGEVSELGLHGDTACSTKGTTSRTSLDSNDRSHG